MKEYFLQHFRSYQVCHNNCVKHNRLGWSAKCKLQSPWGLSGVKIRAVACNRIARSLIVSILPISWIKGNCGKLLLTVCMYP